MEPEHYLGAGSRLRGGPSATLADSAFAHELRSAPYLWRGLGHADMAHLAMLVEAGVVGRDDAAALLEAIEDLLAVDPSEAGLDPGRGDVYNNRDHLLAGRLGERAGMIHAGRARREATTIAWQLAVRARLLRLGEAAAGSLDVLVSAADRHRGTLMPDFTYLHHAHPTTLGHYLLGFAHPVSRDLERLERALALVNRSPAGSGSVNGSRFPLDRALAAGLLECDGIVEHTRDAMWAADMVIEPMAAALTLMTTVDRLAEELQIWTTEEFGFVELDDAHSRTSVVMPQKKNPYALAHLRGTARMLVGTFAGLVATMLTPTGQPDNRVFAYGAVPESLDRVAEAVELLGDVVGRAVFDTDRLAAAASSGYPYATDLCDVLVLEAGIDNRTAHRVVGAAVRAALEAGGAPVDAAALREAAASLGVDLPDLPEAVVTEARDPAAVVATRRTPGGAGPEPMDAMLASLREQAEAALAHWGDHPLHGFEERIPGRVRRLVT